MFAKLTEPEIKDLFFRAIEKRKVLEPVTNALRLVNSKGDGLNSITVDRYNQHFVVQVFDKRFEGLARSVADLITEHLNPAFLIVKNRSASGGHSLYHPQVKTLLGSDPKTTVEEHGLQFALDLRDAINPGLYLDMRSNRKIISALCRGKDVLNCFAYTCSFGVCARWGGAARVVNTDVNKKFLLKGHHNYELNRIEPDKSEFMPVESVHYLEKAVKKQNSFDIIILDPPSFSRHEKKVFIAKRDFPKLIEMAVAILKPKGYLFLSTNVNEITRDNLKDAMHKQAAASKRKILSIDQRGEDIDFPGSGTMKESYLSAVLVNFQ